MRKIDLERQWVSAWAERRHKSMAERRKQTRKAAVVMAVPAAISKVVRRLTRTV